MLRSAKVCALDTEASDKDPRNAVLYGVAFSVRQRQAVYVPLIQSDLDGVSQQEVRARLDKIFSIKTKFVGHNIKFDYLILRKHGMRLRNVYFDTMLAAAECFGDWEFFNLGDVARRLLGARIKRYSDIIQKEQTFLDVPFKDLVEHACTDADVSLRLFHRLSVELRNRQLEDRFLRHRMRMLTTLAEMEFEGVRVDVKKIEMSTNRHLEDADALKKSIFPRGWLRIRPGRSEGDFGRSEKGRSLTGMDNVSFADANCNGATRVASSARRADCKVQESSQAPA